MYTWWRRKALGDAILNAFKDSTFNQGYSTEDVARDCLRLQRLPGGPRRNLIAVGENGKILGAVFHVPTRSENRQGVGSYGWFFTSPDLPLERRANIANSLIEETHTVMKNGGFSEVFVNMGTQEGKLFLKRRHGYTPMEHPTKLGEKVWHKDLRTGKGEETEV